MRRESSRFRNSVKKNNTRILSVPDLGQKNTEKLADLDLGEKKITHLYREILNLNLGPKDSEGNTGYLRF